MENQVTVKQESNLREDGIRPGRIYAPNVEVRETDDALWFWADMPDISQDQVNVSLENDVLRIEGFVKADDYADLTPVYTEYNVGSFQRSFRLPFAVDSEKISAHMRNGVLELQLNKAAEEMPKQIHISSS